MDCVFLLLCIPCNLWRQIWCNFPWCLIFLYPHKHSWFLFRDAVELPETFLWFWVFPFWCVRRVWSPAQFGANCPLLLRQARPFCVFYPMPRELWNFPVRLVGTLFLALYEHQALFPLIPLDRSFPGLTGIDQYSVEYSRGTSCGCLRFLCMHTWPLLSEAVSWELQLPWSLWTQLHLNWGDLLGSTSLPLP